MQSYVSFYSIIFDWTSSDFVYLVSKVIYICGYYSVCVMTSSIIEIRDCIIKYLVLLFFFLSWFLVISLDPKSLLSVPPPHDIHNSIDFCYTHSSFSFPAWKEKCVELIFIIEMFLWPTVHLLTQRSSSKGPFSRPFLWYDERHLLPPNYPRLSQEQWPSLRSTGSWWPVGGPTQSGLSLRDW